MKLTWFDRLLLKVAVAKSIARNYSLCGFGTDASANARFLCLLFSEINRLSLSDCGSKPKENPSVRRRGKIIGSFVGDEGCGYSIDIEGIGVVLVIRDPRESATPDVALSGLTGGKGSGDLP